jgi:hypothetical protein
MAVGADWQSIGKAAADQASQLAAGVHSAWRRVASSKESGSEEQTRAKEAEGFSEQGASNRTDETASAEIGARAAETLGKLTQTHPIHPDEVSALMESLADDLRNTSVFNKKFLVVPAESDEGDEHAEDFSSAPYDYSAKTLGEELRRLEQVNALSDEAAAVREERDKLEVRQSLWRTRRTIQNMYNTLKGIEVFRPTPAAVRTALKELGQLEEAYADVLPAGVSPYETRPHQNHAYWSRLLLPLLDQREEEFFESLYQKAVAQGRLPTVDESLDVSAIRKQLSNNIRTLRFLWENDWPVGPEMLELARDVKTLRQLLEEKLGPPLP